MDPESEEYKESQNEEIKHIMTVQYSLRYQAQLFIVFQDYIDRLNQFKQYKVIKFDKCIQSLLYFLQYPQEKVCEPGTQDFYWKIAKNLLDEKMLKHMEIVRLKGPKHGDYKKYQTLNWIEKNIKDIDENEVFEYNMLLGKLFKWLKLAIETRKLDIVKRMALIAKNRNDREQKMQLKQERETKRETELTEAMEKFADDHRDEIEVYQQWKSKQAEGEDGYGEEDEDEDAASKSKEPPALPKFEEKEFLEKWDDENPDIDIQANQEDDIDNDWVLEEEERAEQIAQYWAAKEPL